MTRLRPALHLALLAAMAACERAPRPPHPAEVSPLVLVVEQPRPVLAAGLEAEALLPAEPVGVADGTPARPFRTLRAALAAAPAGALLQIGEGTFAERLFVPREVVLMGRGPERTRIGTPRGSGPVLLVRTGGRVELHGLALAGGAVGIDAEGGSLRLENVEISGLSDAGVSARGVQLSLRATRLEDVGAGQRGFGLDVAGGTLEARGVVLRAAGRRAIALAGTRALLEGARVSGSSLSALQAVDGADVDVVGGDFRDLGGGALYAGGARLAVRDVHIERVEYAVIAFRNAHVSVRGGELLRYGVAAVAYVNSMGEVRGCTIAHGGTEAAISVTGRTPQPVALFDNRISDPGPFGVHLTQTAVVARGNTITGARLDRQRDMGDAFFGVDSELQLDDNVVRGNDGSGVSGIRSRFELRGNGFIGNGRDGVLLLDRSRAHATGNLFERNGRAQVEVAEQSQAALANNRFGEGAELDIETNCASRGYADVQGGNTFAPALRQRACP